MITPRAGSIVVVLAGAVLVSLLACDQSAITRPLTRLHTSDSGPYEAKAIPQRFPRLIDSLRAGKIPTDFAFKPVAASSDATSIGALAETIEEYDTCDAVTRHCVYPWADPELTATHDDLAAGAMFLSDLHGAISIQGTGFVQRDGYSWGLDLLPFVYADAGTTEAVDYETNGGTCGQNRYNRVSGIHSYEAAYHSGGITEVWLPRFVPFDRECNGEARHSGCGEGGGGGDDGGGDITLRRPASHPHFDCDPEGGITGGGGGEDPNCGWYQLEESDDGGVTWYAIGDPFEICDDDQLENSLPSAPGRLNSVRPVQNKKTAATILAKDALRDGAHSIVYRDLTSNDPVVVAVDTNTANGGALEAAFRGIPELQAFQGSQAATHARLIVGDYNLGAQRNANASSRDKAFVDAVRSSREAGVLGVARGRVLSVLIDQQPATRRTGRTIAPPVLSRHK